MDGISRVDRGGIFVEELRRGGEERLLGETGEARRAEMIQGELDLGTITRLAGLSLGAIINFEASLTGVVVPGHGWFHCASGLGMCQDGAVVAGVMLCDV